MKVNLLVDPERWVLRKTAERIVEHVPGVEFNMVDFHQRIKGPADITHATHWAMWFKQSREVLRKTKNIITVHHLEHMDSRILNSLPWLDKIIVISGQWREYLKRCGIPVSKVAVNRRGVDLDLFHPRDSGYRMLTIGYVGRKYPGGRKGEGLLVDIAKRLEGGNVQFIFIGQRWEKEVEQLRSLGFQVEYLQNLAEKEVAEHVASLDLMLITSKVEGGPFSLLEALASGVPVLSTPVGLARELLSHPDLGKVYESPDEAARYIGGFSSEMRSEDKISKRRKTIKEFSWDSYARRLKRIYEETANG